MKTILSILLSALLACSASARPVTFVWDYNAPEERITGYRMEKMDDSTGLWLTLGITITNIIAVQNFPEEITSVRVVAINMMGEAASDTLEIPITPTGPQGLRVTLTPQTARVDISAPGKGIIIEQSTDLSAWREIAKGWGFVVVNTARMERAFFRAVIAG